MERKADVLSDRLLNFSVAVLKLLQRIDKNQMHHHIVMQLFRSATSIGANYEEARGAESRQDFVHKLQIALKEARESNYWLRIIHKAELAKVEETRDILEENRQLCDILAKSIKTLKDNNTKK